jgi:hypothetical protein
VTLGLMTLLMPVVPLVLDDRGRAGVPVWGGGSNPAAPWSIGILTCDHVVDREVPAMARDGPSVGSVWAPCGRRSSVSEWAW